MNKLERPIELAKTDPAPDTGKRKDILDGARRVFRAAGFDGASMDKIAAAAKVSKGTLYVYFRSKEELFEALVQLDRKDAAEQIFKIEDHDADPKEVLLQLGERFVKLMADPDHIALIRMVIGAAEKLPEVGRMFFEMGPCFGIEQLATYFDGQVARGRLMKVGEDTTMAATHFLTLCQGSITKRLLFGLAERPTDAEIRATVESGVRVFLRAYAPDCV
ncbi:TetR/AcrR family transcriptional regulator [Acuticoccus sediminis]|nr:TetR/AcrR family transcriptional regulator [Acuticoccus sediminis]